MELGDNLIVGKTFVSIDIESDSYIKELILRNDSEILDI
jgi:hypothetical protein